MRWLAPVLSIFLVLAAGDARAGFDEGFAAIERGDYATAIREFTALAETGHVQAQFNLGLLYAKGLGVPQDYAKAMRWYRLAAEQGYADVQNNFGVMYENSEGVPQDYAEALRWYRKAAEQGDAIAQFDLALMYVRGRGVPQDDAEAVKWLRRAAEQGDAENVQHILGFVYHEGQGVPQDNVQALMWFSLAAGQGDEQAAQFRDTITRDMTPDQIAEAQRLEHYPTIWNLRGFPRGWISDSRCGLEKEASLDDETSFQRPSKAACLGG